MSETFQTRAIENLLLKRVPPLYPEVVFFPKLVPIIEETKLPALYKAGLHLWNDDISRCHGIVQTHETPTGKYWHALLHRREKEFENSSYWYRQVGEHPVFERMRALYPDWDPIEFNELCATQGTNPRLEKMHADEMRFLIEASN